jgi:hypothetical protein
VLGLLAQGLDGVARPAPDELGVALLEAEQLTPLANHSCAARVLSSWSLTNSSPPLASPMLRLWAAARFSPKAS